MIERIEEKEVTGKGWCASQEKVLASNSGVGIRIPCF